MSDTRTAVHWGWVRNGRWEENLPRKQRYSLSSYLDVSKDCPARDVCAGWVYKVSDGSWVGVVATPRTIKFYPTEEAAVAAIMLRSG